MVEKAKDRSLDEFFKMMEEKDLYEQDIDISSEFLKMKF
jgi:hypothetical protein